VITVTHAVSGKLYGGVESTLVTLARLRHFVPEMVPRFALCFEGRLLEELKFREVPVWVLNPVRSRYPWSVLRARRELESRLRDDPGPLVCHGAWAYAILGPAARAAGVPVVLWVHGLLNRRLWLDRWALLSTPDLVIYTSNFVARTCAGNFAARVAQVAFHTPLDDRTPALSEPQRAQLRGELGASADEVAIIQVGRMERWKGHVMLVEALARLRDRPDWRCWLVGGAQRPAEAAYLSELTAAVEKHGLQARVGFLGERADVPTLLRCADIFCSPNSQPEPFGSVYVEALYAGLPVVTGRWGGAEEILAGSDLMFEPGSVTGLTQVLKRLLEDASARRSAGLWGPMRARELCDPLRQMRRLQEILQGLAGPSNSGYQQSRRWLADPQRGTPSQPR